MELPKTANLSSNACRVLSWNVNDIMDRNIGIKLASKDFINTLSQNAIFCLQETKKAIKVPNYYCLNSNRTNSRSGGVCIGIHQSIKKYIKKVKTGHADILAVSLSRHYTGYDDDLLIINIYDSPENSSYKKKLIKKGDYEPTIDHLLEFLGKQKSNKVLLVGDFNARTNGVNFESRHENWTDHQQNILWTISRASKDKIINERGRKLLDVFSSCNMSILNGCTLGDGLGEHTCLQYNGSSVIDYAASSMSLREK